MPVLSQIHLTRALTSMSIEFSNSVDQYVAYQLCGRRKVKNRSDSYYEYSRATKRSPAGSAARSLHSLRHGSSEATEVDYTISTSTYNCHTYALRNLVRDEEIMSSDSPLEPIADAARDLVHRLRNDQEYVCAKLLLVKALYAAANQVTLTTGGAGTSWGTASYASANSDPLGNIRTAQAILMPLLGRPGNVFGMGATVSQQLGDHTDIVDVIKYTDGGNYMGGSGLPKMFRSLRTAVGTAVADEAAEGAAYSGDYLFEDHAANTQQALITYVPPGGDLGRRQVASFAIFDMQDPTTGAYGVSLRSYREEARSGWWVEAQLSFDLKALVVDGSGLYTGAYLFDLPIV